MTIPQIGVSDLGDIYSEYVRQAQRHQAVVVLVEQYHGHEWQPRLVAGYQLPQDVDAHVVAASVRN